MTEVVDTKMVIEALMKEKVLWEKKVDDLIVKVIRLEQAIIDMSRVVYPIPQMDLTKINLSK